MVFLSIILLLQLYGKYIDTWCSSSLLDYAEINLRGGRGIEIFIIKFMSDYLTLLIYQWIIHVSLYKYKLNILQLLFSWKWAQSEQCYVGDLFKVTSNKLSSLSLKSRVACPVVGSLLMLGATVWDHSQSEITVNSFAGFNIEFSLGQIFSDDNCLLVQATCSVTGQG